MAVQAVSRTDAAAALYSTAELRTLAAELSAVGVPMLVLKGPLLQERFYGTAAAYRSCDVDVLVRARDLAAIRRHLRATGWRFAERNVLLWRLRRAAVFERNDVVLDLHWGIHAGNLPSWTLRRIDQALWRDASLGSHGLFEPATPSLLVYLAVHAASHRFDRGPWVEMLAAVARRIEDWDEVWSVAGRCRVRGTVRRALDLAVEGRQPHRGPLLDGWRGWLATAVSWTLRGYFVPRPLRAALARRLHRFRPEQS